MVWVPSDLLHNTSYSSASPNSSPYRPLDVTVDGKALPMMQKLIVVKDNITSNVYFIEIPPGSSKIEMTGAHTAVPEFDSVPVLVAVAGITGCHDIKIPFSQIALVALPYASRQELYKY